MTPTAPPSMSAVDRWWFALKPPLWTKFIVAGGLGQAIGILVEGRFDPLMLVVGLLTLACEVAAVILLNDWCDRDVDILRRRLFSESSVPKAIPDAIVDEVSVLRAGLGAAALAVALSMTVQLFAVRPGLAWGALSTLALFWAFSFPPLRLNYRGGGELLEMVGVGFAIPWWQAYVQSGHSVPSGLVVLPAFALLALASALAGGLVDEASDRLGGKCTFVTWYGGPAVRQAIEGLVLAALIVWAFLPLLAPTWCSFWMVLPAIAMLGIEVRDLHECSKAYDIDTYHGLSRYRAHVEHCVWRGTMALAGMLLLKGLLSGGLGVFGLE